MLTLELSGDKRWTGFLIQERLGRRVVGQTYEGRSSIALLPFSQGRPRLEGQSGKALVIPPTDGWAPASGMMHPLYD